MFELLRRGQLKQCLVFLGEPGIESGQNNADYMMSTSDDTDKTQTTTGSTHQVRHGPMPACVRGAFVPSRL